MRTRAIVRCSYERCVLTTVWRAGAAFRAAAVKLEPAAPSVTSAAPQADEPKPVVAKQPAPPIGLDEMFAKAKKELYNYDPPREGQAPIDWASVQRDFEDCCRGAVERAVARGENLVPGCRLYIEVA